MMLPGALLLFSLFAFICHLVTHVHWPSLACSCPMCGCGCDTQDEQSLDVVKRGEKEHETQGSGVAPSVVAFGGQVTKLKIPEGSIGCRYEFVTGWRYRQSAELWVLHS